MRGKRTAAEADPQQAAPPDPAQAAYEAPPGLVDDGSPPEAKVVFYAALFAARTDLCATDSTTPAPGKGLVPAVRGGWRKGTRHEGRDYLPLPQPCSPRT